MVEQPALAPARPVVDHGGPILTMDAGDRVAEALLVEGDRIAAVGSDAELRERNGRKSRVVDLQGKALLPGFIDAHAHFPGAGIFAVLLDLNSPPIGDIGTIADIVERLRERAAGTSRSGWVVGMTSADDAVVTLRGCSFTGRGGTETKGIQNVTNTTRRTVREAVAAWIETAEPLPELEKALTYPHGPFSKQRAELIASTEVTRAYAEANNKVFQSVGIPPAIFLPPAHPRCR